MVTEFSNGKVIKVLIGQVSLTRPPNILQSILGSCIGLIFYDARERLAGLAHILLPCSEGRQESALCGKYADRAVVCLYEGLVKYGARPNAIKAKMAGGARMFNSSEKDEIKDVGSLNIVAVQALLKQMQIPLVASDTGGRNGRKIDFDVATLQLSIEDFSQHRQVL